MYTEESVRGMTVAQLKKIIKDNGWDAGGARLKSDFRNVVIENSYLEEQAAGLSKLVSLAIC
jgi:hypothetical protein